MRYRILVVEDDPEYAEIYQDWLLSKEYISSAVESPAQAKAAFRYFDPHALVLDLALPEEKQGFEIAKYALHRKVPVVIVTAFPSYTNARVAFKHYRVVDFIPKQSVSRDTLIAAIRSAIRAFEQLSTKSEEEDWVGDAEQSVDLLAKLTQAHKRVPDRLLTTHVHFFPDQRSFVVSRSAPLAGYGEFTPPFEGRIPTVLKLFDPLTASDLGEEEIAFLDSRGFGVPPSEDNLRAIGQELYRSLTNPHPESSTTSDALEMLLAKQERGPERIHLCFSEQAVSLASYPWELLHDGRRFLAQLRTRITRSVVYGESIGKLDIDWPARILMVEPRPVNAPRLGWKEGSAVCEEMEALGKSSKFDIVRMSPPVTYRRVASKLARARSEDPFDILYFDGHGEFGWQCECGQINPPAELRCSNRYCARDFSENIQDRPEPQGFLLFEHESRIHSPLSALQSVTVFGDSGLKMVVLSACNSTMVQGTSLFNSVGPKLLETGIPAVVGMQFPAKEKDTTVFFKDVFGSLSNRTRITATTLETAIKNARRQIHSNWWFCPALYLRAE